MEDRAIDIIWKRCLTCNKEKQINLFHFWTDRKSFSKQCEECFKKKKAIYRKENAKAIKEYQKKYRSTGAARINARKWAKENPIRLAEKRKEQYKKHESKIKEKAALRKYPSQSKKYAKRYREINYKSIIESRSKYNHKITLELYPAYCRSVLKKQGFSESVINQNPELIEVKRLILKTKRLCKTLQNSEAAL